MVGLYMAPPKNAIGRWLVENFANALVGHLAIDRWGAGPQPILQSVENRDSAIMTHSLQIVGTSKTFSSARVKFSRLRPPLGLDLSALSPPRS